MQFVRQLLAIAWKEIQVAAKDRGSLAILFLLPMLLASMFGGMTAAGGSEEGESPSFTLQVILVNLDEGQFGDRLAAALEGVDILEVEELDNESSANQALVEGSYAAAVIVPRDFSQKIVDYEQNSVRVLVDPTQNESGDVVVGVTSSIVDELVVWGEVQHGVHAVMDASGALAGAPPEAVAAAEAQTTGVIMTRLDEMRRQPGIDVKFENVSGAQTFTDFIDIYLAVTLPGFAVMFSFFLISTVIVGSYFQEQDDGTFRRLIAAPLSPAAILGGKMVAYILVVALQVVVLFGLGSILGMQAPESVFAVGLITLCLALVVTALGMLVSVLADSEAQAGSIGNLLAFGLAGLGGAIPVGALFLVFRSEGTLGTISRLTPHGQAMEGFFRALNEGASVVGVLPQAGALLAFAAVFFGIGIWRFRAS